jgi:two-component system, chemotaxis family, chemotaxis protein CheY
MDILAYKDRQELLDYLPHIKSSLKEWLLIEVRLIADSDKKFLIADAAKLIDSLFRDKEGKLYICNDREILALMRWGQKRPASDVAENIRHRLPAGTCEIQAHDVTPEGIAKLEILITHGKQPGKIVLVADDDMYMRMLVKKGAGEGNTVYEVADGKDILDAYKKYVPNILFLDIHLPNVNGTDVLRTILTMDSKAYIVMLSADSSRENVALTMQQGAKGFLTKPFTREKLQEYILKCPVGS